VQNLVQCGPNDQLSSDDSLFERYIKGYVIPHFHVLIWDVKRNVDVGDYCIVIKRALPKSEEWPIGAGEVDYRLFGYGLRHSEQLMFVSCIKVVQQPKGMKFRVRSVIRLQLAQFCECAKMNASEFPFNPIVERPDVTKNRKKRVAVGNIASRQMPCKVVQCTPGIMESVPENKSKPTLRDRLGYLHPEEIFALFRIEFSFDSIGIGIEESLDFRVERLGVFFGAAQFVPTFF
jgi:hypothetical protein